MKRTTRWLTKTVAVVAAVSCLCCAAFAAPGGNGGGPGGGPGGGGGNGGGGGGGNGGPPQIYLTAEMQEGAAFVYGDLTLTLSNAEGTAFTLTQGEKAVACTAEYEEITEGQYPNVKGIAHLSQLTVTGADDMEALLSMMPALWSDDRTLILLDKNTDTTPLDIPVFSPSLDVSKAAVDFTAESVKNADSATGYSTTISVSDADKSLSSVLVYGKWMCSYADDEDAAVYEPEAWENGMYYSDYGIRAMTYDEEAKAWTLTLNLASANMEIQCFANVEEDMLSDVSDDACETVLIPYDAEKQSASFNWSNTAACAQAGTLTTVEVSEDIKLRVYTPYGYDPADTETKYPVLYLIAGMNASYDSWLDGGCQANVIFDNLIANGTVAPTILVAMERDVARMDCYDIWESADDRSKNNGDGDGYINYVEGAEKGSGIENMIQSAVVTTVVPFIDANYNTAADAEHRGVVGCSMGGVAASQIWMTDYEMFNFYGFFSGSDMWFKAADDAKAADEYKALKETYEADYTALLNAVAANMDGVKILVGGGITDRNSFGGDQNSSGSDNIHAWLTEAGIDHEYSIVGGGHDWTSWTQLLDQFAGLLAEDGTTWKVTDLDSSAWYYDAVEYVVSEGIMNGIGGGKFAPDVNLSRAMLVTILWRLEGEPDCGDEGGTFADVPENEWFTEAVEWAAANEIVMGYGNGLFGASDEITREQMATILYRYAQFKGEDVSAEGDLSVFADSEKVSDWAETAMKWAVAEEILNGCGDGTLAPAGFATRAQAAQVLWNMNK